MRLYLTLCPAGNFPRPLNGRPLDFPEFIASTGGFVVKFRDKERSATATGDKNDRGGRPAKKIHRTVNHFLKTVMPFNGGRFAGEKQMRPESFLCGAKFLEKMQGRCGQTNRSERRRTGNGNICPDAFSKFGARTMKPFRCDDAKTR